MKKRLFLLPLISFCLGACNVSLNEQNQENTEENEEDIINVEDIILSKNEINLHKGDKYTLTATVLPEDASNKKVVWSSDDTEIATVKNGVVNAISEGSALITVTTKDGGLTDQCVVNISESGGSQDEEEDDGSIKNATINQKTFNTETKNLVTTVEDVTFTFSKENGTYEPGYYTGANGSYKLYVGNKLTIAATKGTITKIDFQFNSSKDSSSLPLIPSIGSFNANYSSWTGSANSLEITTGTEGGSCRAFSSISVTYQTSPHHDNVNLGLKTIKETREYIENASKTGVFSVNQYGMGVDKYTKVTIQGIAMSKLHLLKTTEKYGYNLTEPNKVVIGDSTDSIAVASKLGDGTLFNKVDDNQMKNESKYEITGYISMCQGQPELICTSYTWDKTLDVNYDLSKISKGNISINDFYEKAEALNYNISGYAYGKTYTLKNLTCFASETGGSGKTWYNFTDGTNNIRVNAYNVGTASVGKCYDVTGVISMEKYSPIIIAYEIKSSNQTPIDVNEFYKNASEMSITNLKKIKFVNNTEKKYPEMINSWKNIYKTTGYITTVSEAEGTRFYIGISDTYITTYNNQFLSGTQSSSANYNLALFKNNNYWNVDDPYGKYNKFAEYTDSETPITIYYIPRQTGFYDGKMYWEILLIPQFIESFQN